jgi:hypothetical protein
LEAKEDMPMAAPTFGTILVSLDGSPERRAGASIGSQACTSGGRQAMGRAVLTIAPPAIAIAVHGAILPPIAR